MNEPVMNTVYDQLSEKYVRRALIRRGNNRLIDIHELYYSSRPKGRHRLLVVNTEVNKTKMFQQTDFPCFNLGLSQIMPGTPATIKISESHTRFNQTTPRFVRPAPATETRPTAGTSSITARSIRPRPPTPAAVKQEGPGALTPPSARFLELTPDEVLDIENARNERATDMQTKVYIKILKDWCVARSVDPKFELLDPDELCQLLRRFYAEVRRQDNTPYSASSMRCMRAAIQRHLKSAPYNRTFNIMSDARFNPANKVYTGKLKLIKREGGRPPKHKGNIAEGDLRKMMDSEALEPSNPVGLQRLVFVYIALHFCRRGRKASMS
ncbi:uncharacterized protein [Amphiura filiformis]|uniref:uncharacterized protein n=1 Tax=Amphiura filiformis TaxID=82378 RepID=UPI003B20C0DA